MFPTIRTNIKKGKNMNTRNITILGSLGLCGLLFIAVHTAHAGSLEALVISSPSSTQESVSTTTESSERGRGKKMREQIGKRGVKNQRGKVGFGGRHNVLVVNPPSMRKKGSKKKGNKLTFIRK